MLIRFVVENVFSFGERTEFNMLPYKRLQTLDYHRYNLLDFDVLKMASIYGANGAGKSNLIKALALLKELVTEEEIPLNLKNAPFKFNDNQERSQILAVEFIEQEKAFYYGVEILGNTVVTEELYESGLGKKEDKLIFERKTNQNGETELQFFEAFEKDEKGSVFKSVLMDENLINPEKTILNFISKRNNPLLNEVKKVFHWFGKLLFVTPDLKPSEALPYFMDKDIGGFKDYANQLICSLNIGIETLSVEKTSASEFFPQKNDLQEISDWMKNSKEDFVHLKQDQQVFTVSKELDGIWVQELKIEHHGNQTSAKFSMSEESDGTIRLLDFIPVFKNLIENQRVFIIDEIERSIHPLLIKELVRKFSLDESTKGQLIFTTHESNLLDQEIFRQDEIWFAEKNQQGSTDLYPLTKRTVEHKTIDIRKGYLNGRYGSIPFLGNLKDLNWHSYETAE